jgi:hypothetical protein
MKRVLLSILVLTGLPSIKGEEPPFELKAQPITMLRGGPMILLLEPKYVGTATLEASGLAHGRPKFKAPKEWGITLDVIVRPVYGRPPHRFPLESTPIKTKHLHVLNLTQRCPEAPLGRSTVRVELPIYRVVPELNSLIRTAPEQKILLGTISADVEVEVLELTEARLRTLAATLLERVKKPRPDSPDVDLAFEHLRHLTRPEFIDLGFALLDRPEMTKEFGAISWCIVKSFTDLADLDRRCLDYLERNDPVAGVELFTAWIAHPDRKWGLPDGVSERLKGAPHPFIRALSYVNYPEVWNQRLLNELLRDLSQQTRKVDRQRFAKLLKPLESDDVKIRADAQKELLNFRSGAIPLIEAELKRDTLSLLLRESLTNSLFELKKLSSTPFETEFVWYVSRFPDRVRAKRVVVALSQGHPDAPLTREASKSLGEWENRNSGR